MLHLVCIGAPNLYSTSRIILSTHVMFDMVLINNYYYLFIYLLLLLFVIFFYIYSERSLSSYIKTIGRGLLGWVIEFRVLSNFGILIFSFLNQQTRDL